MRDAVTVPCLIEAAKRITSRPKGRPYSTASRRLELLFGQH